MTSEGQRDKSVVVKASDFGLLGDGNDGGAFEAAENFAQLQKSVEDLCKDGGQLASVICRAGQMATVQRVSELGVRGPGWLF